jgi:RNA methyltransferase, TrmH family
MISKEKRRRIKALGSIKFRILYRNFIAEGPKIVGELLNSSFSANSIFATREWLEGNNIHIPKGVEVIEIDENDLAGISNLKSPNQVLALIQIPEEPATLPQVNDFVLLLDGISDPGNMGTIIRTADWFGIQFIVCSENCVDVYNPRVVQSTAGSVFRVPLFYADPEKFLINQSERLQVFGASLDGDNIYSVNSDNAGIIIIGSESHGISSNLIPFITNKVKIPDYSSGKSFAAESLNASQATAIICAEFRRRTFPNN